MKNNTYHKSTATPATIAGILGCCSLVAVILGCNATSVTPQGSPTGSMSPPLTQKPQAKSGLPAKPLSQANSKSKTKSAIKSIAGKWVMDLAKMDIGTGQGAAAAREAAPTTYMVFKKDGHYTWTIDGMKAFKGRYTLKGKHVTLTLAGQSFPTHLSGNHGILDKTGDLLTFNKGSKRVVFKRKK